MQQARLTATQQLALLAQEAGKTVEEALATWGFAAQHHRIIDAAKQERVAEIARQQMLELPEALRLPTLPS